MKSFTQTKRKYFLLLLPIGAFLTYLASLFPHLVERVYSNGFYRFISQPISRAVGWVPFSLAEAIIIALVILVISGLFRLLVLKGTRKRRKAALSWGLNLLCAGSLIYFVFVMTWGLNYHRLLFARIANFKVQQTSAAELAEVCEDIIGRANSLRSRVAENEKGIMQINGSKAKLYIRAAEGYAKAAFIYPQLGGSYGRPKGVYLSKLMSYAGISGVYFPFPGEANINTLIPDAFLPSTVCHEMAHQRGFAREDEANYIAYLASSLHPEVDFQYSGVLLALTNSMNMLYNYDPDKYQELRKTYAEGVARDLADLSAFWRKYEGPIEKASSKVNDLYLKTNKQTDGVFSYNRMVDLLIAEYRMKKGR